MELTTERDGDVVIATAAGRLDGMAAPAFQETLENAIRDTDRAVILDMGGTDYVSSAGLRAILLVGKSLARNRGKLIAHGLSTGVREVFTISGFDRMIPIVDNREAARALAE